MSRCRACLFRVHPSGLAFLLGEAFPDKAEFFLARHRTRGLLSLLKNPRPKSSTTSDYKLSLAFWFSHERTRQAELLVPAVWFFDSPYRRGGCHTPI